MKHSSALSWALACLAGGLAVPASVLAAVPTTAAVEAVLTSSGGPVADGSYVITFAIYGAASGGTALWTEGPVAIATKNGQFNWQLGSKVALSPAGLSLAAAWLGVTVGNDPELPRVPLNATLFAERAAIAEGLECSGCIKAASLDAGVLAPYAKAADLGNFAKTADLSAYAKTADLAAYAKTADLDAYAKVASLAAVAASGAYGDLKGAPKLSDVASTGAYGDLTGKPTLPKLGDKCGTGLVMNGIKNDGSLDCGPLNIPPDYIDEISNGLIWNQFVDSQAGGTDVAILDGIGAGQKNDLVFPDIGLAQAIWVNVDLLNSDVSSLQIELFGPGIASPYILYAKGMQGQTIKTAFNKDTAIVSGDLNKDWVGKNPKGTWSIVVKDPLKNQLNSSTDGKFSWGIGIQTLSTKKIQVKGDAFIDGNVWAAKSISGTGVCGNGLLETGEKCDDGNKVDGDGCSPLCDASAADKNCAAILAKNPAAKTGVYTIDADGPTGPLPAWTTVCDMTNDGGGWTRFIRHTDPDGLTGITVDNWNLGIVRAAQGGIKQWMVKTYQDPTLSTEAGSKHWNAWVMNVTAGIQGRAFTYFRHTERLNFDQHRYNGPGLIDSAKILAGSQCTAWNPSYNDGAYLWLEHKWSANFSVGWMWMSHCGAPSYHMLIINHDYDYGAGNGRPQTLVGTDQNPQGATSYDEDGGAWEFFYK